MEDDEELVVSPEALEAVSVWEKSHLLGVFRWEADDLRSVTGEIGARIAADTTESLSLIIIITCCYTPTYTPVNTFSLILFSLSWELAEVVGKT